MMSRKLVAYFSASGVTAKVAESLSEAIGADIYAIEPKIPYTKADLNWMNKNSRSSVEMRDPNSRPEIAELRDNMDEYDVIFVGFPIWWYQEIYQHFNVSKTLSTRKGLCFDYANLFVVFCRSQDIPCFVVDGYSRSDSLAKHTWNRVYFSNTWWNADLTNDAINTKNGKTLYGFHPLDNYDSEDEDFVITRIY